MRNLLVYRQDEAKFPLDAVRSFIGNSNNMEEVPSSMGHPIEWHTFSDDRGDSSICYLFDSLGAISILGSGEAAILAVFELSKSGVSNLRLTDSDQSNALKRAFSNLRRGVETKGACNAETWVSHWQLDVETIDFSRETSLMHHRLNLQLKPGRVYRPKQFAHLAKNPTVVFERLVDEGKLERLGYGLYHCPRLGRFGPRPPDDKALLDAFLGGSNYVLSGPNVWNGLRLGPTGLAAVPVVYNTKRSGQIKVGPRTFNFRRVRFPRNPTREWYAVDLLNHAQEAGTAIADLAGPLAIALREASLDPCVFFAAVDKYATRTTKNLVKQKLSNERLDAFRS